jgi:very-short-patch-repair endonuclease
MGVFVLDFYCDRAKLAIEVDGYHHGLDGAHERDEARDARVEARGVRTLRIPASEVLGNLEGALDAVFAVVTQIRGQRRSCG